MQNYLSNDFSYEDQYTKKFAPLHPGEHLRDAHRAASRGLAAAMEKVEGSATYRSLSDPAKVNSTIQELQRLDTSVEEVRQAAQWKMDELIRRVAECEDENASADQIIHELDDMMNAFNMEATTYLISQCGKLTAANRTLVESERTSALQLQSFNQLQEQLNLLKSNPSSEVSTKQMQELLDEMKRSNARRDVSTETAERELIELRQQLATVRAGKDLADSTNILQGNYASIEREMNVERLELVRKNQEFKSNRDHFKVLYELEMEKRIDADRNSSTATNELNDLKLRNAVLGIQYIGVVGQVELKDKRIAELETKKKDLEMKVSTSAEEKKGLDRKIADPENDLQC